MNRLINKAYKRKLYSLFKNLRLRRANVGNYIYIVYSRDDVKKIKDIIGLAKEENNNISRPLKGI